MFGHVSMRKANRHGESLSIAKRVVKAEFEMDIWLFTNSNKQFFSNEQVAPC